VSFYNTSPVIFLRGARTRHPGYERRKTGRNAKIAGRAVIALDTAPSWHTKYQNKKPRRLRWLALDRMRSTN